MALRIAIVGPGRVGTAFARAFVDSKAELLGLLGRDPERVQAEVSSLGCGDVLKWSDLSSAHVVIFTVGDRDLDSCVKAASSNGGRRCSLWLHTSGRHTLKVFAPAADLGVRTGSLHPLLPFSGATAAKSMSGGLALISGEPRSLRLLRRLCDMLELQAVSCAEQNRELYHAACALAANGATALFSSARQLLSRAGGLADRDSERIVASLMQAAVASSAEHGAAKALSGPVRRGDDATVKAHLEELRQDSSGAAEVYVALMRQALMLARDQGLPVVACDRIQSALSMLPPSP
jgi:predicted short-subunit dehydrogenase-like oxidoreductase (DUF2520 family)